MKKLKVAEIFFIFFSLQGEGYWTGQPSVFLRTFGCNFQCRGFGMPNGKKTDEPERIAEQLKENPEWSYNDLPLAKTGCDSYASWHPAFKTLSPTFDIDNVVSEIELARIGGPNANISNDGSVHLVITGGEPLLGWQRVYPELLDKVTEKGYSHITFETNGTQKISDDFADYLFRQKLMTNKPIDFTFSVSPKLPCSGEKVEDTLKPEIVENYQAFGRTYLKFVVESLSDSKDVNQYVEAYRKAGFQGEVYIMPCGGDKETYEKSATEAAKVAMLFGYRYTPRLQVDLWGNAWAT